MDDVGSHFHCLVFSLVPCLALLTQIRCLAHFFLSPHLLGRTHTLKTCSLRYLCHVWVQRVDTAQLVRRQWLLGQLPAVYFVRKVVKKSVQHSNTRFCCQLFNRICMLLVPQPRCILW